MDFNENWKCKRNRRDKKGTGNFQNWSWQILKDNEKHFVSFIIRIKKVLFYIYTNLLQKNISMAMDIIINKISAMRMYRIVYTN